jgi:hypothetical protein
MARSVYPCVCLRARIGHPCVPLCARIVNVNSKGTPCCKTGAESQDRGPPGKARVCFPAMHVIALLLPMITLATCCSVEKPLLEERLRKRDSVQQAHAKSVVLIEEAQAALSSLGTRRGEIDSILGEVREQVGWLLDTACLFVQQTLNPNPAHRNFNSTGQLEETKRALLTLTKADLDQLRRMPDPPVPVRRTLEMVPTLNPKP